MENSGADWRAWAGAAQNLLTSAQVLWQARKKDHPPGTFGAPDLDGTRHADIAAPTASGGWRPFDYSPTFLLLAGLALEALCKAVIVQREARLVNRLAAPLPAKYMRGHSVTTLIEAVGLQLQQDERNLAERLQTYVAWAGRYPIPKANQPNSELVVREADLPLLLALYRRIDDLLRVPVDKPSF